MNRADLLEDGRFKKAFARLKKENTGHLQEIVSEWVASKDEKELLETAKQYGFPLSSVMDDVQICQDEWRRDRGSVLLYDDEMYKKLALAGPAAMLSKTPARIKWLTRPLGYHNRYIFKKLLKLSEKEIKALEKEGVVGYWDYRVGQRPPVYYDMGKDRIFNYGGSEEH